jgi:hypothetical protein
VKSAFLLTALFLLAPMPLAANDSDASVGLGDVVLTREPRISMESERLTISLSKVTVEYEAGNATTMPAPAAAATPEAPTVAAKRRRFGWVGGLILATVAVWWLRRRRAG